LLEKETSWSQNERRKYETVWSQTEMQKMWLEIGGGAGCDFHNWKWRGVNGALGVAV
jgi:hypothetical protein